MTCAGEVLISQRSHDRVVVSSLVGSSRRSIRVGEEHAGEFDAAALTARACRGLRSRRGLSGEECAICAASVGDHPPELVNCWSELDVAFHGPLLASATIVDISCSALANARDDRVDAAHGDDAVAAISG